MVFYIKKFTDWTNCVSNIFLVFCFFLFLFQETQEVQTEERLQLRAEPVLVRQTEESLFLAQTIVIGYEKL